MTEQHNNISRIAFFKWIDAGSPLGDGSRFWFEAEKEYEKMVKIDEPKPHVAEFPETLAKTIKTEDDNNSKKEVSPSENHPQSPLQNAKKKPWFCQTLLERLFPILVESRSDTSPSKD